MLQKVFFTAKYLQQKSPTILTKTTSDYNKKVVKQYFCYEFIANRNHKLFQ
jgi:hypothetical protein